MLSEFLEPISQELQRHRRQPGPQEQEFHRAGTGAGMIVTAAFYGGRLALAPEFREQALAVLRGRLAVPEAVWIAGGAWVLFLGVGFLLLLTGARRSRGARDMLVAAKALAWITAAAALLWRGAFVPNSPLVNSCLLTIYLWTLASGCTRLFLALRGMRAESLPDPESLPDLPMSGPASRRQARDGMSGEDDWVPPRFPS